MKLWLGCAAAVLAAACGRLGYEPLLSEEVDGGAGIRNLDASVDASAGGADAGAGGPAGRFGEAVLVPDLGEPDAVDDDPSLTGDLLELYFKSDRGSPGQFDIWRARRGAVDQPWGPAERVEELSSGAFDATPEVSLDGLVLFLSSARSGTGGGADIWVSSRASRADGWSEPVRVAELSSERDEWAAVTDASRTHAVITRSAPGQSLDLLAAARRSPTEPWSAPVPIASLATRVYEADAHLDPTGLQLIFAGELPGGQDRDLYRAERASLDGAFGEPLRLVELSSPARDEDPWVSPDGRLIVFSSDRTGDQELYWARR